MPHLGLKNTFAIKLAFLAKEMAQINRQYEGFLDQINGLKRVENLFGTFWQILDIVTAHSVMKCPQMPK